MSNATVTKMKPGRERTNGVQIEHRIYEMPPKEGISIAQFLTVDDIERSAHWYEKVFGARILSLGDGNAPGYLQACEYLDDSQCRRRSNS